MAELTLVEAINDCFHVELGRDDDVMVMGEDVGRAGGVFRATAGLRERFGAGPLLRHAARGGGDHGRCVGLCMAGWRPVCEIQYDAFSYPALDQLITHVGRYRWRTGGTMTFPLTVRMPYGGGVRAPELHDDSPETYYVHTPGVKVAIPSTPADAKGLLPRRSAATTRSSCSSRSRTTGRCAGRCPRASTWCARQGTDRARGHRRHAGRVRLDGAAREQVADALAGECVSRCSTSAR